MKQCIALLILGVLILQQGIALEVRAPRVGKSYFFAAMLHRLIIYKRFKLDHVFDSLLTFSFSAIIGGGIGGASASHFLTELLNGILDIDLYEAKTIGGRLATIEIDRDEVEAGGSIIHPKNMYMQRFVTLLGKYRLLVSLVHLY